MCATCGCSPEAEHTHHHHDHREPRVIQLERDVLSKNAALAADNRAWLLDRRLAAFNLVSSPGSGKTTLLERTVREYGSPIAVIEGDQATDHDAIRIRAAGARAVQVTTGAICHLDAHMVGHALEDLDPTRGTLVFIENVGNLVCPALFDLGERAKILVASVTEGEDKPVKYPHMFRAAELVVLNKIDLAPHVDFDAARFRAYLAEVNPKAQILAVSARRGDGLGEWYAWLRARSA